MLMIEETARFLLMHPLTRRRRMAAVLRFARWQVRSRLSRDVEVEWIAGAKVIARRGMNGFTGNIYCGLHEYIDMSLVLHALRPGDLFLDVGANVGSYTILASAVCGARTSAFEPDPDTAALLRRNVEANPRAGRIEVHETALGDRSGEADLTMGWGAMNRLATEGKGPTRRVRMARLDDVPSVRDATLMKIDVEGFEGSVLAGADKVLGDTTLLAILSESFDEDVTSVMRRHGFERAFYDPGSRTLARTPFGDRRSNGLFVRDWAALSERVAAAPRRRVIGQWV